MSSVTNSAAQAASSLFGAIATTATQLGNTVNTTGKALSMLDAYVESAANDQRVRYAAQAKQRDKTIAAQVTLEIALQQVAISKQLASDPILKQAYAEIHAEITEAVATASASL